MVLPNNLQQHAIAPRLMIKQASLRKQHINITGLELYKEWPWKKGYNMQADMLQGGLFRIGCRHYADNYSYSRQFQIIISTGSLAESVLGSESDQ